MKYKVEFTSDSLKFLKKTDIQTKTLLLGWIKRNLVDCNQPRLQGKSLAGSLKGLWRYRVGDYRIVAKIKDAEITIVIVDIGHRKNIYSSRK